MQRVFHFAVHVEEEPCWGGTSCTLHTAVFPSPQAREKAKGLPLSIIRFDASLQDYKALNGEQWSPPVPVGDKKFVDEFYEEWRKQ